MTSSAQVCYVVAETIGSFMLYNGQGRAVRCVAQIE